MKARTRERRELFKLKDNAGTTTHGYKLAMNTFRQEIKRQFLAIRGVSFWKSFPMRVVGEGNN